MLISEPAGTVATKCGGLMIYAVFFSFFVKIYWHKLSYGAKYLKQILLKQILQFLADGNILGFKVVLLIEENKL